jgi:hypothetical protein
MFAQPAPPDPMIGLPAGDDLPEAGPVAENPQVRQFVDDYRFQRLGRRQDQTPRERQAPRTRAATPSGPGVPYRDRRRRYRQSSGVAFDLTMDGGTSPLAEPGLEDLPKASPLGGRQPHHELVAFLAALARDGGAAMGWALHDPKAVGLAVVPDNASIAERADLRDLPTLPSLAVQMTAQPILASGHERGRDLLGPISIASRPGRHGHQGPQPWIGRQTKQLRPRRSADGAVKGSTGEAKSRSPLGCCCRHTHSVAPVRSRNLGRHGRVTTFATTSSNTRSDEGPRRGGRGRDDEGKRGQGKQGSGSDAGPFACPARNPAWTGASSGSQPARDLGIGSSPPTTLSW